MHYCPMITPAQYRTALGKRAAARGRRVTSGAVAEMAENVHYFEAMYRASPDLSLWSMEAVSSLPSNNM